MEGRLAALISACSWASRRTSRFSSKATTSAAMHRRILARTIEEIGGIAHTLGGQTPGPFRVYWLARNTRSNPRTGVEAH